MLRFFISLIFILASYNSICQISQGNMFGFIEGSFSAKKRNEKFQSQNRSGELYATNRDISCQVGTKFLLTQYISLGFSIGFENSRVISNSKTFEVPSYIGAFNLQDAYLKASGHEGKYSRSIEVMPNLAIYKSIGKSGLLLFEFAYFRQYVNYRSDYQSYNYQSYSDDNTYENTYTYKGRYWGFSFKPYFILKGYKRFYISYSPLSFSYSQPVKKYSYQHSFSSTFETSFNPISIGLFFKLN